MKTYGESFMKKLLIFALCLVPLLCACGKDEQAPQPPQTLKVQIYDRGDVPEGAGTVTDNAMTRYIKSEFGEKNNIDVRFVPVARNNGAELEVLIATGDAPDIMFNYSYQGTYDFYRSGYTKDLTEYISPDSSFESVAKDFDEWVAAAFGESISFKSVFRAKGIDAMHSYSVENMRHYEEIDDTIKVQIFKLMNSYLNLGMVDNADKLFSQLRSGLDETNLRELVRFLYENSCFELESDFDTVCAEGDVVSAFNALCSAVRNFNENDDVLIKKIKDYINKNFSKDITLESVANKVYLHSVYVSRYFKSHTGQNFSDYLFNVRMIHAIDLLKTDKYKIGQWARWWVIAIISIFQSSLRITPAIPRKSISARCGL